jgi:hypothetical protein
MKREGQVRYEFVAGFFDGRDVRATALIRESRMLEQPGQTKNTARCIGRRV